MTPKILYISDLKKYAVCKSLLSPKFAKKYTEVAIKERNFALIPSEIALEHLEEWKKPNLMDDYTYCGIFKPYPHQEYSSRFICMHENLHNNSAMGCGKSMSSLWAFDQMIHKGLIKKVLIVCTKNGLFNTWEKELGQNLIHRSYEIVHGEKSKRVKLANADVNFIVINHDGLTSLIKSKYMPFDFDYICYDESTKLKSPSADRYKTFYKYYNQLKTSNGTKLILMTGTPIAQSPCDAYTQAKLIDPNSVPRNYTMWKDMVLYKLRDYVYIPKQTAPETCYKALTPALRFELDDCVNLPALQYIQVKCEKSVEQAKMFKQMVNDYLITLGEEDSEIFAVNSAAKYTKMLQILGGAVYKEDHTVIKVDTTPRLEALCELIDEVYPKPVIVVCNYRHVFALLEEYLKKHYKGIAAVTGDTSSKELNQIIGQLNEGKLSILLSMPEIISHSIDLTISNTIIMYQPFPKNEVNLQIADRIRRLSSVTKGHTKLCIYQMYNDNTERLIYEKLKDKTLTQNKLFMLIRQELQNEYAI